MDEPPSLNLTHLVRPAPQPSGRGSTPGLLLLHGRGADEADLIGLEGALDPRLTIVSARAPFRLGPGFAWYGMREVGNPDAETLHYSLEQLQEFIEELPAAYDLDPQQIYILGFSQGAIMASALAMTVSDSVSGVIMHSGYVPIESGLPLQPETIEDKPFFIAHGLYDDVISINFGRASEAYLSQHHARVTYREYPIGHSISEESLYDLSEWLSSQL